MGHSLALSDSVKSHTQAQNIKYANNGPKTKESKKMSQEFQPHGSFLSKNERQGFCGGENQHT